ncbi:MAG: bifunctional diaminohydroxyphosphoribosylaminopyrimidine deaminase/5-amino-6-(5-phosphoribosylamino)uracil reductase [Lachnospiraceae bacterium]|nr:bifunctional diaminohydroxyphosphoribosylaminopyrimidine deaminase/5-amino-6-(5-phosphoribosylamino)uracil reductase [Lachnospiraceae bacterium]
MNDEYYMRLALELAVRGRGYTNPNPMVGAVIVKNGRIIGEGYHEKYGHLHAERNALGNCTEKPDGATIYVTLEPCCHHGKTPPCTDLMRILGEKGIDSILLEGGSQLNFSAIEAQIVDEVHTYIAPKIFGGDAKTPVGGDGIGRIEDAVILDPVKITKLGDDILVESEVKYGVHRDS